MDGTLVDHSKALASCYQHACRELGQREPSLEEVRRAIGGSMPVTIRKFLPSQLVKRGKELWSERFGKIHLQDVELLEGARELLDRCCKLGIAAGVFTNKTGRHARAILDQEGLSPKLAFALGAEDTPYRKPQPEFSAIALEKLGLPGEQVAMIGDSPFDIQAAKNGSMTALCVDTGSHTSAELLEAGADRVFSSLSEIARWLSS